MYRLAALLLPLLALACEKEEVVPASALSTWELSEIYIDPGDGSGDFEPTDFARTLSFFPDSTYRASTPLCAVGTGEGRSATGRYFPADSTLEVADCSMERLLTYAIDGTELTVTYFCDEGCAERYVRVEP